MQELKNNSPENVDKMTIHFLICQLGQCLDFWEREEVKEELKELLEIDESKKGLI